MRYAYMVVSLALVASACSNGSVTPIGKDTYMLSGTAAWSWSSGAAIKADLFREADAFCRNQGKQVMPVSTDSNNGSFSQFAQAEIDFRCLNENDPEFKRPNLEPAPNIRIDNRSQ